MLYNDSTTSLLLSLSRFVTKRGSDMGSRQELLERLDEITGSKGSLKGLYVNTTDNYKIPDVAVIHCYQPTFANFLLRPDTTLTCPFGYTVEIHERCFDKYTEEEIGALLIHDILQNAMSDTAKIRFLRAYTEVLSAHDNDLIMDLFGSTTSLSEITFMMFTEICLRPFRVPANQVYDYVATDEVLRTMGLADAYDSYLNKSLPMSNDSVESRIDLEVRLDVRDVNTILNAALDKDIRHYYNVIRTAVPLITLEHILTPAKGSAALGFSSRHDVVNPRSPALAQLIQESAMPGAMNETYNSPSDEIEIRFQIDKIINAMRYAETEAERDVLLFRIKQLSLKLYRAEKNVRKNPNDPRLKEKLKFLKECQDELDELRKKCVNMEISIKRWSVYAKDQMPDGYDF